MIQRKSWTLGIHFGHDSSVAAFDGNELKYVEYEDRLTRIKHHHGFPIQSLLRFLEQFEVASEHVQCIAFATEQISFPDKNNVVQVGADGVSQFYDVIPETLRERRHYELGNLVREWGDNAPRLHIKHQRKLEELGLFSDEIRYFQVNHHRCHAAINRLRGYRAPLVVTADGRGDGITNCVFTMDEEQQLTLLASNSADQSLCAFYQAVTEALDFLPVDSEYKIMGMAGCEPALEPNAFRALFDVVGLNIQSQVRWTWRDYNEAYPDRSNANKLSSVTYSDEIRRLRGKFSDVQIASMAQVTFERTLVDLISAAFSATGAKHVFGSGGGFLNAKANQRIQSAIGSNKLSIFPDSSDGGLSIGAAIEAIHITKGAKDFHAKTVELGSIPNEHHFPETGSKPVKADARVVADLVSRGVVLGIFKGRGQVGPRALGGRSILADARRIETRARINGRLKAREWFVPFAPVCLREDADRFFSGLEQRPYLMTETVECTPECQRFAPAIVHYDGSSRPQIVELDDKGWLRELLEAYRDITGAGLLLNTSFNRHGLPICGSAEDAFTHYRNGWVDAIVIGQSLFVDKLDP